MKIRYTGNADRRILEKGDLGLKREVVWAGKSDVQDVAKESGEQIILLDGFEAVEGDTKAPTKTEDSSEPDSTDTNTNTETPED